MKSANRKILITAALPYANGPIHIGHLVEYIQADFWSRFQKMQGNECLYICADDTHGTAIMIRARDQKITPEELIAKVQKEHILDFKDFQIEFSHYGSTNSSENQKLCNEFYRKLKENNHISIRSIKQLFCEHDNMFLPDRFVKGTCPKCGSKDQYGDNCDVCAATYSPADLKDPYCSICRTKPVFKNSDHYFVKLNDFKSFLSKWIPEHTSSEVSKKMLEWFNEDLRDWDISRDAPYFGFPIPDTNNQKYFYVWVDAPMGYVSSTQQWCDKNGRKLDEFWKAKDAEIYHFIGKDITYFHTLFWPALLKTAGYNTPTQVFVHGMLMVNGEKMSKSKGTFVSARSYLKNLNPEYLRYYYASKLNNSNDDLDLNLEDFTARVNSDLVGKITNLGSRGAQMLTKKLDGKMSDPDSDGLKVIKSAHEKIKSITTHYEARDFSKAITEIREIADIANRYFDEKAPWKTLEQNPEETKKVLTTTLNIFRTICILLKPVLPEFTQKVEKLFNEKNYAWLDAGNIIKNHKINDYEHLITRIDSKNIENMIEQSKAENMTNQKASSSETTPINTSNNKSTASNSSDKTTDNKSAANSAGTIASVTASDANSLIDFEDFMKVDLRVAKVIEAEEIKEADKLLRLKVDIGNGEIKNIIAGIKAAYNPEKLVGKNIVVVANLKPRKMKFGVSEGMVLAAGTGGSDLFVISPDGGAQHGQRVK